MNELLTQVNVIQTAVNSLERDVKCPKDEMQRTHFCGAIGDIKTAVKMLKEIIAHQAPQD